ncbi:MAG: Dehydrogenases with different specificities (related to short-chain alcohol dehydrogenases) [uncultured Ramlibacter sp.]|uniref:Dehydrogenases with different specificities (Related to short-chain alcohol dehydrogenases) n=1 Tax=uncultured Ramlibacter sp. TaxID=260755 RepID=A0A6J4NJA5_9BURK|nr:MAG: Dehydrogenases with different specificities (related to short-chain alcohol dehydrogenases) [uncultured Ramlibacter sp.]
MNVLVLGASRGIGLEFVRQYRAAGDRVIATARNAEGTARIEALGAKALKLDVAEPASTSGLAWQLDGEKFDVALYVAGVYSTAGATEPPTREDFDRVMHTNVLGAMQVIPQVAPLVEAAAGRFVFITSEMGHITGTGSSFGWLYRVSKAGLNMAVAAASHDYPKATLVAMSPGWVRTDMGGPGAPLAPEQSVSSMRKAIAALTPRQRGSFLDYDGKPFKGW